MLQWAVLVNACWLRCSFYIEPDYSSLILMLEGPFEPFVLSYVYRFGLRNFFCRHAGLLSIL